ALHEDLQTLARALWRDDLADDSPERLDAFFRRRLSSLRCREIGQARIAVEGEIDIASLRERVRDVQLGEIEEAFAHHAQDFQSHRLLQRAAGTGDLLQMLAIHELVRV